MNALSEMATGFAATLQNVSFDKNAPAVNADKSAGEVKKAVEEFESFFISQMFKSMADTVPVNETFGGGYAEKLFRSMLTDEYGKMAAKSGGIGVSDAIMKQIIDMQAAATQA